MAVSLAHVSQRLTAATGGGRYVFGQPLTGGGRYVFGQPPARDGRRFFNHVPARDGRSHRSPARRADVLRRYSSAVPESGR